MKKTVLSLIVATVFSGCQVAGRLGNHITGSGNRHVERRQVADFNAIQASGAYQVTVVCGKDRSLEIEADDNILPLIKSEVKGGRLVISNDDGFNTRTSPSVRITVPDLKELSAPGASNVEVSNVKNDSFTIDIEGATKLHCSGETNSLSVNLSGAGSVDARDLHAQTANITSNGAGFVSVYAADHLDTTINGVGSVDYYGNPKTVNKQVNGVGSVNKK